MSASRWNDDPVNHTETCPDCGGTFDMRDLAAVFAHVHDATALAQIRSILGDRPVVSPGREVLDPDDASTRDA